MLNGLLLVDKPKDWTSFDVVAKIRGVITRYYRENPGVYFCEQCSEEVRRAIESTDGVAEISSRTSGKAVSRETYIKQIYFAPRGHRHKIRVGHTGTLDPKATGLLVLAIGKATKQIQYLMKMDKTYQASIILGKNSSTDDSEGELSEISAKEPTETEIMKSLESFTGKIEQVPPAFSAIKVDGQRAYKAARAGKPIVLKSRFVRIISIEDVVYEYPSLSFTTTVSSGTYIRSLARDIGKNLGSGAYLGDLRRLSIGDFSLDSTSSLDELLTIENIQSHLTEVKL